MSTHFVSFSTNPFYIFIIAIVRPCIESNSWVFCESASIGYFFPPIIYFLIVYKYVIFCKCVLGMYKETVESILNNICRLNGMGNYSCQATGIRVGLSPSIALFSGLRLCCIFHAPPFSNVSRVDNTLSLVTFCT